MIKNWKWGRPGNGAGGLSNVSDVKDDNNKRTEAQVFFAHALSLMSFPEVIKLVFLISIVN